MKKYKHILDVVLLAGLAVIATLAVAPKALVMPTSLQMLLVAAVLVLLSVFLVFMWRERPEDEREVCNQAIASRSAYTVGTVILIVALIVQSLQHHLDSVVPLALISMIATKIIVQRYKDNQ